MTRKLIVIIIAAIFMAVSSGASRADDSTLWTTTTTPDALIILDNTGSMQDLPAGSPATLYVCGSSSNCSGSGPFYPSAQPSPLPSTLYDISGTGGTCSGSNPFYGVSPGLMPTANMYILSGNSCSSYTGPFYTVQPSNAWGLSSTSTAYISSSLSCTGGSSVAFYPLNATGHTKSCPIGTSTSTSSLGGLTTVYSAGDCTNTSTGGPFYSTSKSGHTTACYLYSSCTPPTTGYTSGSCTATGAIFYKAPQSGYITACGTATTCTPPSTMYTDTATDCTIGPLYVSSTTGYTYACQACNTVCSISDGSNNYPLYGDPNCSVAYYSNTNTTGYTTDCSKIQIAKLAIFSLMNATNSGTLTSADVNSLGVRLGYMNYYNCQSSGACSTYSYPNVCQSISGASDASIYGSSSSCIQLIWPLTEPDDVTTTPYSDIYCNNSTSCLSTNTSSCTTSSPQMKCVAGATPSGGTPLGAALQQGATYLTYQKLCDPSSACRQKSMILITDGADTFSCPTYGSNAEPGGNGNGHCGDGATTCDAQRRSPVYYAAAAKALGYQVFVVGFGSSMPVIDQYTLNWTAFFGGTRDPNATQSGSVTGFTPSTNPCANGTDPGAWTTSGSTTTYTYPLTGYAFIANNTSDLVSALQAAISAIQAGEYSFSAEAAVAAARISSENFIYEASFNPENTQGNAKEPFWTGHLKKYAINPSNGQITNIPEWDAGAVLMNTAYTSRHMWTLKNGTMTRFNTTNITDADLGTGTSTTTCAAAGDCITGCSCGNVVGFYQGNTTASPSDNLEQWKLGDLYHTNPMIVQTPNQYFFDPRECSPVSGSSSYASFYASNQRSSAAGNQLILAGGNDGQLHAFTTGNGSDPTAGGNEVWSFIPPNLLQKIAPMAHNDHSNRSELNSHDFFVDGPLQEEDAVWLPSSAGSGVTKNAADWKSILILEEGQGSGNFLWSSSSNCYVPYTTTSTGFSATYDPTNYPYYCGLYALNVTNTSSTQPTYLWNLNPTSAQASYLGQAWSKMQIGRVKISGNEKWVGFIGGGYDGTSCTPAAGGGVSELCTTVATGSSGKSFNVVDLTNGQILWQFTYGIAATSTTNPNMTFDLAGSPIAFDMDGDGFVDTAYIGDLGGNIWRFRFCIADPLCSSCGLSSYTASPSCTSSSYPASPPAHSPLSYGTCGTSSWKGSLFFQSTDAERGSGLASPANTHKQIFTQPQASIDNNGNWWIFWGTGESTNPTFELSTDTSTTKNRFYAVTEANLASLDSAGTAYPTFTTAGTNSNTYPLQNVTTQAFSPGTANSGWYYNLSTNPLTGPFGASGATATLSNPVGEKMISDPAVFGVVYFTTYLPAQGTATACGQAGTSFLYELDFLTGYGAWNNNSGVTSQYLAPGISSSVLISISPTGTGDVYTSGYNVGSYGPGNHNNALMPSSRTNILYWQDQRLNQ